MAIHHKCRRFNTEQSAHSGLRGKVIVVGVYFVHQQQIGPLQMRHDPSMTMENRKGGLWKTNNAKSATNRLVNTGWSTKPSKIFLNIRSTLRYKFPVAGLRATSTANFYVITPKYSANGEILHLTQGNVKECAGLSLNLARCYDKPARTFAPEASKNLAHVILK